MANLVPAADIERIVGARRHSIKHIGRLVSAEETAYILHSQTCIDHITSYSSDLRQCPFSIAMDDLNDLEFVGYMDRPIMLAASSDGELLPADIAMIREVAPPWTDHSEPIEHLPAPTESEQTNG